MRRIDQNTVNKILDTADIVEVVSDFVSLKRKGNSYIGLCPFHNERTPSFSVSKARGYCKCFSCGKGGSAVGFIMEHEQLSYGEALRWLANKYHIEVEEEEMTPEQMAAATERESMLALNDFALQHFEHNLHDTADGRAIGLAYFRERGLTDAAIRRFRLGYALDRRDALMADAISKGYSEKLLLDTGLCGKSDRGGLYDRFRGRVIYPVFALSGKVLAFGGRTLRKEKDVSKYVNSPESLIYHKSNQLYGLYQARRAIVAADKCILVEGYMDVISMSQRGVENVVASSGTSLTEGQISLIHRFTENVTVIYDSDPAGIKASLRGIDMLLAEGLNIKVMLLPEGDDPDSFAQAHTLEEIQAYMAEHETDFIRFKTDILMADVAPNDPTSRARVVNSIVRSISMIADEVTRQEYVKDAARQLAVPQTTLQLQVTRMRGEAAEARERQETRQAAAESVQQSHPVAEVAIEPTVIRHTAASTDNDMARFMRPYELEVLRLVLKYAMVHLCDTTDEESGRTLPVNVIEYVDSELRTDEITFTDSALKQAFDAAWALRGQWAEARAARMIHLQAERDRTLAEGREAIAREARAVADAQRREQELQAGADEELLRAITEFDELYASRALASHPDDAVRTLTTTLVSEKYVLSKIHTKHSHVETERDLLSTKVPRAVYGLKNALLEWREKQLRLQMAQAAAQGQNDRVMELMQQQLELRQIIADLAKYLGERIVLPRRN